MSTRFIKRYDEGDRVSHWLVAISFVLAGLSGLAFFHPSMYWLTNLFGGGPWTRILHPFIGTFMALAFFLFLVVRMWRHNKMTADDKKWLGQWRDVVNNDEHKLPEQGKNNAGQKMMFWLMFWCMVVITATGFLFWRPYFAYLSSVEVHRVAVLLHAAAASILIIGIIVHVYAAIWVKGSFRAMLRGDVSERWAKKHHAAWHREVTTKS